MQKIHEAAIGKKQQIIGFKVLIFRLHYITMYFTDAQFRNKVPVTTQAFVFSRFKKQTPKSSSQLSRNLATVQPGYWLLSFQVLLCAATFKLGQTCRHNKKDSYRPPGDLCINFKTLLPYCFLGHLLAAQMHVSLVSV